MLSPYMLHCQNISYLVDAFNWKQLIYFNFSVQILHSWKSIISKLTMQQNIHDLEVSSDGKIVQISSGYDTQL